MIFKHILVYCALKDKFKKLFFSPMSFKARDNDFKTIQQFIF